MNTIPTTSKRARASYTVVGGAKRSSEGCSNDLSLLLLNRGPSLDRGKVLSTLKSIGIREIFSIESTTGTYEIESLTQRFPSVKFILLHEPATAGEYINVGIEEAKNPYILVLWNDMRLTQPTHLLQNIEKIKALDALCITPFSTNERGVVLPSIKSPAFYKKTIRIVHLQPERDKMLTIYPYEYCGIYNKTRFTLSGGFDSSISNPFWQKLDFGFRAFMWGEVIRCSKLMRIMFPESTPAEDSSLDESYRIFFLKNLLVRFDGEKGGIRSSRRLPYILKSGGNLFSALKEFKNVREWIETNAYRFKMDAKGVTGLWEAP